ncbi:MAG: hypothetical protein DMG32_02520 [Acidobacteria bacterium]|nr:MAG: hypothetical protein DMG32_02520 [Acidobacteriota bacterium]
MDPLDPAIAGMWDTYHAHYPDPLRPVHSALMEVYMRRFERLWVIVPAASVDPAEWHALFPELQELAEEMRELFSYLGDNPLIVPTPPGECGQYLIQQGFSFEETESSIQAASRTGPGRPPSVRVRAVTALEMKMAGNASWRQIAIRLCPCGADHHDHACAERIRQAVNDLQNALRKYGIDPACLL